MWCSGFTLAVRDAMEVLNQPRPWALYRGLVNPYPTLPIYYLKFLLFAAIDLPLLFGSIGGNIFEIQAALVASGVVMVTCVIISVFVFLPRTLRTYKAHRLNVFSSSNVTRSSSKDQQQPAALEGEERQRSKVIRLWKHVQETEHVGKLAVVVDVLVFLSDYANFFIGLAVYKLEGFDPISTALTIVSMMDMFLTTSSFVSLLYVWLVRVHSGCQYTCSMVILFVIYSPAAIICAVLYGTTTDEVLDAVGKDEETDLDSWSFTDEGAVAAVAIAAASTFLVVSTILGCCLVILPQYCCCRGKKQDRIDDSGVALLAPSSSA